MKPLSIALMLVVLLGCLAAQIDVQYDKEMKPMSCHADYLSIGRDVEGAAFNVCGGKASTQKSTSAEVISQVVEGAMRAALK